MLYYTVSLWLQHCFSCKGEMKPYYIIKNHLAKIAVSLQQCFWYEAQITTYEEF